MKSTMKYGSKKNTGNGQLEELKLLDLRSCNTVSDVVEGMSHCSFGARMLGEIAKTLHIMISNKDKKELPLIIYDGKQNVPLYKLMQQMVKKKWATRIITPETYSKEKKKGEKNLLIIGGYGERFEDALYKKPSRTIFINNTNQVKPGQTKDGYFPDVIFSDPNYILPVIYLALLERLEGKKTTITEMMKELKKYPGIALKISMGADSFNAMVSDKDCFKFMTLSGAMTIAKMGLVICDMIDEGMIDCVSSTGALMAHGLVESIGLHHYKHNPKHNDTLLAEKKLNRVTDTLEPETNFTHVDEVINTVMNKFESGQIISPSILHKEIGCYLAEKFPNDRGILKSCYLKNVPVQVPAFNDSEIGNDVYVHNLARIKDGKKKVIMDMELDSKALIEMATKAKKTGIFTIGGGVPRNNVQNVAPLIEIANDRLGLNMPERAFMYGTKICPDPMYYGHLSGCTYSEGMSWRKMDPKGKFVEIKCDATIAWPFIVKYAMENKK